MSVMKNCICLICDRCGQTEYYVSDLYAENIGWERDLLIPGQEKMDLCPHCSGKWHGLVRKFLIDSNTKGEN